MPSLIASAFKYVFSKAFLKQLVVSYAIGEVMKALAPEQEIPKFNASIKTNNTSNVSPIPVVYGRRRVGGSEFRAVAGNNNQFLLRTMVISEGEIESVESVHLNERLSTDSDIAPLYTENIRLGEPNQIASTLMTQNVPSWGSSMRGNGVAYIVARLKYDKDVFASGLPELNVTVKGKKVYDPRKDNGGEIRVLTTHTLGAMTSLSASSGYQNLLTNATGHPSVNNGLLRIQWSKIGGSTTSGTKSYDKDTNTLTINNVSTSSTAKNYGGYFRINGLKEGVTYRVTGKVRVSANSTNGTASVGWDLSDGQDTGEFNTTRSNTDFTEITTAGYFSINGSANTSVSVHSFIDLKWQLNGQTASSFSVQFKDLVIDELVTTTINTNSAQTQDNVTHSQTNSATWEWSDNPALCILDFLTNTVYGRSIPYSDIDLDSFIQEANYCDDRTLSLRDASGNIVSGQKRYTCNGLVNPDEASLNSLKHLLLSCRGHLVVSDKYKLVIDKPAVSVKTFDERNIIGDWNIVGSGVKAFKNRISGRFFDRDNDYNEGISVTTGTGMLAKDNNRILEADIQYNFTDTQQRVDLLSQHILKESRLKWNVEFTATLDAIGIEAMDVISIKHSAVGWNSGSLENGKLFRVQKVDITKEDTVKITAKEYDPSVYTFDVNTPPQAPSTNLPDPQSAPAPSNLTLTSTNYLINKDGTIVERIKASWDEPTLKYVRFYEIAYRAEEDSQYTIIATNDTNFVISPVNSAVSNTSDVNSATSGKYYVKVRAVYPSGKRSDYAVPTNGGFPHQVVGKTAIPNVPASFAYAQSADYTRQFLFTAPADKDVKGFIIKVSTNANATWDNMDAIHTGHLTVSPFETKSLQAGTYKMSIRTLDTSNNLSNELTLLNQVVTDDPNVDILNAYYPKLLGWTNVGTITNGSVNISNEIDSVAGSDGEWQDLGSKTWAQYTQWGFASSTVTYTANGFEFGTALTFRPIIQASVIGTASTTIQYVPESVSGNSGYSSSDYGALVNGTFVSGASSNITATNQITAKAIKFSTTVTGVNATIQTIGLLLDGKQKTELIKDLNTSTLTQIGGTAGHVKIPLQTSFAQVNTLTIAFNNAGGGMSYEIISKTSTTNNLLTPTIKLYNSSNANTNATIDITVTGF
tara:strand:- start:2987 stop:6427 length:3441 start_codon:yes stop_codon:yes gene_type:complete